MERIHPGNIQVVVNNVNSNEILLQDAKGINPKEQDLKTTEYFLEVQGQDTNVVVHQAQFVTIGNECGEVQDGESQYLPLEMDDNGQIILQDKHVIVWDELCRICANSSDKIVPIFSDEGLKHNLCIKIQNYLSLDITEHDSLPLQVCYNCAATLLAWHEMIANCSNAQQRLLDLQNKLHSKNQLQNNISDAIEVGFADNGTELEVYSNQENQMQVGADEEFATQTAQPPNEPETDRSSTVRSSAAGSFKDFRKRYKPRVSSNAHQSSAKARTKAISSRASSRVAKDEAKVSKEQQSRQDDELLAVKKEEKSDDDFEVEIKEEETATTISSSSTTKRSRRKQKLASPKNLECKQCGKAFRLSKSYEIHMRQHTGEKPFTCHICGKQFGQTGSLYYHLKHLHGGVKNHACDICGRCFAMKTAMEDHRRIHTGERPYICDVCGKTFKTKASLYIHSKIHTDEYPFNCSYCNKPFRWKQQMISHLTTHTGEKNHICEICNKGFGVKNELTRHRRTHSTDKPFTCQKCNLSFGQKRYLTNHNRTRHKIKPLNAT